VLADSHGYITILKRNGAFRSRFPTPTKGVINLAKQSVNVIYSSTHSVGFVKFVDSSAGSLMCEAGSETRLVGAYLDPTSPGLIYAGTDQAEILVFDSHSTIHRQEIVECKLIARIHTNL
jgi:hypothetical protein